LSLQKRHIKTNEAITAKNESKAKPNVAMLSDSVEVKNPKAVITMLHSSVANASFRATTDNFITTLSGSFCRGGNMVSSIHETQTFSTADSPLSEVKSDES
jgi:hypothetical protein